MTEDVPHDDFCQRGYRHAWMGETIKVAMAPVKALGDVFRRMRNAA